MSDSIEPDSTSPNNQYSQKFIARVTQRMRGDVAAGVLLVIAATFGFIAANTPLQDAYTTLRDTTFGPASLGLHLSLGQWASDGLLAIFFFLVGLELKQEFVAGDLRKPSAALVPVAAAFGGVAVPALLYFLLTKGTPFTSGWAIPTATDIAFAIAVLGLIAPRIPTSLRIFLLTLAVVDDLVAIGIIAVFFTTSLNWMMLGLALIPLVIYAVVARSFSRGFIKYNIAAWIILLPIGVITWAFVHLSGVHATVAGVILAFMIPVTGKHGEKMTSTFEYRYTPLSVGVAVPVFAFFAAGVSISGDHRFPVDPIAIGIIVGLVIGKPLGIVLATLVVTKLTPAKLAGNPSFRDILGIGALAGVGFTVALLVAELSFADPIDQNTARLGVIVASLMAIVLASALLIRKRPRTKAKILSQIGEDV